MELDGAAKGKVLDARAKLLSDAGRYLIKIGNRLMEEAQKAKVKRMDFGMHDREKLWQGSTTDERFAVIEDNYRKALVEVIQGSSLPARGYALPQPTTPAAKVTQVPQPTVTVAAIAFDAEGEASDVETSIFARLGIQGLGAEVFFRPPSSKCLPP